MSRTGHKLLAGSGAKDAYEIDQSLMLPDDANAHLLKNISSAGNRKTWTWSGWVKRYKLQGSSSTVSYFLWSAYDNSTQNDATWFSLQFYRDDIRVGAWTQNYRVTSRLFRDLNAWYHIVLAVDTTQSTASDRIKLYINGEHWTGFDSPSNPGQNDDLGIGNTTWHMLGSVNASGTTGYAKHYIAETHFIDGTALTADSFGKTDSVTGQWVPKEYTGGSYGTNGYYLKFASGAIGTDSSGQSNNYTASNVADSDVMIDTPTNNFSTMNLLDTGSYCTVSLGNLTSEGNTSADAGWSHSNFSMTDGSGKWYSEHRVGALFAAGNNYPSIGVSSIKDSYYTGTMTTSRLYPNYCYIMATGNVDEYGSIFTEQSSMDLGATLAAGDIISIAVDTDNKKIWMGKNGTWNGSGNPGGNSNPTFTYSTATELVFSTQHLKGTGSGETASSVRSNYGQDSTFNGAIAASSNADANGYGEFKYAVPSGFKALCTKNLPTPAVKKSTEHFNTILYTGNDADDRTLTGVGFQPDLVWFKARNEAANWHTIFDSVRGVSKRIFPNSNNVELVEADPNNSLVAFTSDGFTVDDSSGHSDLNASAHYYVAYNWKANGSGSADTSADIDATVSANTTAGFSIVTWTGNGSNTDTVPHGLGTTPKVVLYKQRSSAASHWYWWTSVLDGSQDYLLLSDSAAKADINTSTYGSLGSSTFSNFGYANPVVAYCFAEVEGFSKFGIYEANNSTDGPFVHTGFTPAWVVFKYFDGGSEWWWMFDNKRSWLQPNTVVLYPNAANAEATVSSSGAVDFLSNGFKIRATNGGINYQNTYMYMAFAEYPFKYANAR